MENCFKVTSILNGNVFASFIANSRLTVPDFKKNSTENPKILQVEMMRPMTNVLQCHLIPKFLPYGMINGKEK